MEFTLLAGIHQFIFTSRNSLKNLIKITFHLYEKEYHFTIYQTITFRKFTEGSKNNSSLSVRKKIENKGL